MANELDNKQLELETQSSNEQQTPVLNAQEAPKETAEQEEELFFWSEPGVCG